MAVHQSIRKLETISATVISVMMGLMIFGPFRDVWAEELKWKEEKFNVTFVDADVRDVLTDILKRNDKTAVFLPGVQGVVTFDFRDNPMLIEAAFNKILAENNLTYTFDVGNNTVKVLQAASAAVVDDIFTPNYGDLQSILDAFARFGLGGGVEITADHIANVLFFHGAQADVTTLKKIATEVDASLQNIQNRKLKDLEQQRLQSSVSVEEERARREKEEIDAERSVTVEVIPLRYTNVSQSTTSFQGEKVTLPGILDSLRAFVGPITVYDASKEDKKSAQESPTSVSSGNKPVVSVDVRTNSIIVQGTPNQIKRVIDVVKKLDKEVPLVEIEVMIVAGTADASRKFGIQLGTTNLFGPNASQIQPSETGSGSVSTLTFPESGSSSTDIPVKLGETQMLSTNDGFGAQFIYRGTREFLEATIDNLASNGKVQTVASPRVVTLNNLPANISNTVKITNLAVSSVTIGDTKSSSSSSQNQSSVEAGVTLVITPSVIHTDEDDGTRLVRLAIDAKNSKADPLNEGIASTSGQGVQTNIIIPDGATFVLGGLFNTRRSESHSGIPFLKDLPVVGNLFGNKASTDTREETVFFITPKVFSYKDIVTTQGVRAKDYVEGQRSVLDQEQKTLERESQLLSMPVMNVSEDE
ncbi:MAG: type II secretion system protein GspD [Magnetococcales bacterium]|nr:type II secretion system protein GspD [Magnetococcales bacterium]MBF0150074.1 type II secretion system protein GspD [Magnetococcales bacterium]